MAFELFTKHSSRAGGEAKVSVSKNGMLCVNARCHGNWLKDVRAVQLMYDPERRTIALKPVPEGTEHAYAYRGGKSSATLSANAFLNHYGLAHKATKAYPAKWDDQIKAVVIKL